MTEQDLQAIRAIMREELEPINKRLEHLEESQEEVRDAVNALLEWLNKMNSGFVAK